MYRLCSHGVLAQELTKLFSSMSSSLCRRCVFSFASSVSTPAIRSRSTIHQLVHALQLPSRSARLHANLSRSSFNGTSSQPVTSRQFSSSPVTFRKRVEKKKAPSKHQLALITKRRAAKRGKDAYAHEKMTLADAISVLRVGLLSLRLSCRSLAVFWYARQWRLRDPTRRMSW